MQSGILHSFLAHHIGHAAGDAFMIVMEAIELRLDDVRLHLDPGSASTARITLVQRALGRLLSALGVRADQLVGVPSAMLQDAAYEISVPLPQGAVAKAAAPQCDGPYFVWKLEKLGAGS